MSEKRYKLDDIDRKILFYLQVNCKIPYHEIGKRLKIAPSTVHNRVKRLIKNKIIKAFSAILDPKKLGLNIVSWIGINTKPGKLKEVAKKLISYEEVQVVGSSYGDHDILIQITCRSPNELSNFIRTKIKTIDGVKDEPHIHSSIFTEVFKVANWLPLRELEKDIKIPTPFLEPSE
ncbi:MAG: Lrp/AsnC family transcriptional regulator [Candidatus Helarchaeota archaeon]